MEKLGNHPGSLFHVGFWVEDLEEMHDFLSAYMDVETVIRAPRENGGERLILRDARGQFIELLSEPGKVQARPEIPHHPIGRTAGVTHIAVYTDDTLALKEDVQKKGYEIIAQAPEENTDGYLDTGGKKYRILYVRGPSDVTFEFFEIK